MRNRAVYAAVVCPKAKSRLVYITKCYECASCGEASYNMTLGNQPFMLECKWEQPKEDSHGAV